MNNMFTLKEAKQVLLDDMIDTYIRKVNKNISVLEAKDILHMLQIRGIDDIVIYEENEVIDEDEI